jgi:hypothetical protein
MRQNEPGLRPERQSNRHEPAQFGVHGLAGDDLQGHCAVNAFPASQILTRISVGHTSLTEDGVLKEDCLRRINNRIRSRQNPR